MKEEQKAKESERANLTLSAKLAPENFTLNIVKGLSLLVDAEEAKDVKNKDLVIDPVSPAGTLILINLIGLLDTKSSS